MTHPPALASLSIRVGDLRLVARWEPDAPRTIEAIRRLLPLEGRLVHVQWSGEATWIPLGELRLGVGFEHQTSHPAPGEILVYPGDLSECEILIPYGGCVFSSRVGQLAGNHVATIVQGRPQLAELGRRVLWEGAQPIVVNEER